MLFRSALVPPTGARTDFDILRILSHQLAKAGLGKAMHFRTPEAVFDEIRQHIRGYDLSWAALLAGGAQMSAPEAQLDGARPFDAPVEGVFSARDTLFTSGSLGRYCTVIRSCPEANE